MYLAVDYHVLGRGQRHVGILSKRTRIVASDFTIICNGRERGPLEIEAAGRCRCRLRLAHGRLVEEIGSYGVDSLFDQFYERKLLTDARLL